MLSFSPEIICSNYPVTVFHLSGFLLVFHKEIPCCSVLGHRAREGGCPVLLSESGLDISSVCITKTEGCFKDRATTVPY